MCEYQKRLLVDLKVLIKLNPILKIYILFDDTVLSLVQSLLYRYICLFVQESIFNLI